jgi:hypothetical protein
MSPKLHADSQCQYKNTRGHRCHMLIDNHHRPTDGTNRPTLCAYHASKIKTGLPTPDPEVAAAELLNGVDQFSTADEVNLFLGNLIKQLAHKRIARRDAIALAYISQLLLSTLRAMQQEYEAEKYEAGNRSLLEGFLKLRSASPAEQPSTHPNTLTTTQTGAASTTMQSKVS